MSEAGVTPKSFDLSKIRTKSMEIFAKYLNFWANYVKIRLKFAPNVVWFWEIGAQRDRITSRPFLEVIQTMICLGGNTHTNSCPKTFRASFGVNRAKNLLHLQKFAWSYIYDLLTIFDVTFFFEGPAPFSSSLWWLYQSLWFNTGLIK